MLFTIIVIVCLIALFVYGSRLRRSVHKSSSLEPYVAGLDKTGDEALDKTLLQAKVVAMENGIDLNK